MTLEEGKRRGAELRWRRVGFRRGQMRWVLRLLNGAVVRWCEDWPRLPVKPLGHTGEP